VRFSGVTAALATSDEQQRDSEVEDSWAFTRIWYSRDQHHGKAYLGVYDEMNKLLISSCVSKPQSGSQ
jgi:hypothetical protein